MCAVSLIDKLREVETLSPSHEPTIGEVVSILGRLVAYVEHGEDFLRAAYDDAKARESGEPATRVNDLLSPPPPPPEPPPTAPAPAAAPEDADRDAQIAALRQELATAQAQLQRTQAETTPTTSAGVL